MTTMQLYQLVAAILGAHLILLAFSVGAMRTLRKRFVNPEDAAFSKTARAEEEHDDVQRARRAHTNALENAVPFFVVGALYAMSGASKSAAQIYFFTFLGARLVHSVAYLLGKQPYRTIPFAVGALATLGMALHVIRTLV